MSPEICAKLRYDGSATDVWASGILLYTMLFGHQPFKAANEAELYKKIIKGTFKLPKIIEYDGTLIFEGHPNIKNAETIKNLLNELLATDEDERIKTGEILIKYKDWLAIQ